jgi:hypothetical protein
MPDGSIVGEPGSQYVYGYEQSVGTVPTTISG